MDFSFVRSAGYKWNDELAAALEHVDQGSVVRGVSLVYAANGAFGVLPQTQILKGTSGGVKLITCDAMITSQTCDIRGPGSKKTALLNVAPVYPLTTWNETAHLNGIAKTAYLEHVTGGEFMSAPHVVDLRFETSIEKSIIMHREVVSGFRTGAERAEFAKKLGEYRRRGAFDPILENSLLTPLEQLFKQSITPEDVYEVRVFAHPSVSYAKSARLIVACELTCEIEFIRATMGKWYDDLRERQNGLNLLPLMIESVDKLTVADIRGSVPVYFRTLSGVPEA